MKASVLRRKPVKRRSTAASKGTRFAGLAPLLSRALFGLAMSAAAAMLLMVILAPIMDNGRSPLWALFAEDLMVRRTAIASGLGLAVTAWVFFRFPPAPSEPPNPPRPPQPPTVVGA